jgi:subtilase family serine protease
MRLRPVLAALCLCLLALPCAAPAGAADGVPVQAAPQLPGGASFVGAVAPERQLDLYVALEPRDPAALASFAEEVATPGSPAYGDYLSVPQFAARFGPTPAQVSTVSSALAAQGLDVGAPSANNLSLPVTATAAEAEAAFGTAIDRVDSPRGRAAFGNRAAPRVPAAAAPYVQGILGLDNLKESHRADAQPESDPPSPSALGTTGVGSATTSRVATTSVVTGGPQPCAEAIATGASGPGNTIDQIAAAYDLPGFYSAGNFGAGQTVALLELEPFLAKDIEDFQACYGTHTAVEAVNVGKGPGPYAGEDGEAAMDIENLLGLAPDAQIVVYQAKNEGDAETKILTQYVTENRAKVMSSSWGICEPEEEDSEIAATNTLLQEAAAQGQSFFVAAGDEGSTDCWTSTEDDRSLQVDFPGSSPFATDVGGTRMEAVGSPTNFLWNAPAWGAGGGGRSAHFAMPDYQLGAGSGLGVIDALSSGAPCGLGSGYCRQVPDVAADAALETGWVIHAEEAWEVNGGTSAAAPFWAAVATLTNASAACGGHAIGFVNPALYALGGSAYATNFRDVTGPFTGGKPTTDRFDETEPFPAKVGYDMATGLGTPIASSLGASLCALANPPAPAVVPTPAPAPRTTPQTPTPAPSPTPAGVSRAHLGGASKGRPRLAFTVTAREGSLIGNVTVRLPAGTSIAQEPRALEAAITVRGKYGKRVEFRARATGGKIHIPLRSPVPLVKLTIGYPALTLRPNMLANIREGRTHKLGLVVTTRESGGTGTRLPLTVGV